MKKNNAIAAIEKIAETYAGDTKKQYKELKRLASAGKKSGDLLLVGAAYCRLAEVCYALDDLDGILSNSLKAVALLKETDAYDLIANSYASLGHAYTYQENDQMALVCDEIAFQLVKKHRLKGSIRVRVLNNLSVSYHMMGDVKKGIRFQKACLDLLWKSRDDYIGLAMYTLNLAECYKDDKKPEVAREILESMESWIGDVPFEPVVCDYYLRCAVISYILGDSAAGNRYTDRALGMIPENTYPPPVYDDLRQVAHFLSQNKDRERAEKILDLMTVYAEKNKGTIAQLFAVRMMADYYRNFGEFGLASDYYAKYEELNDKRLHEIKEMQLTLHSATKNAEIEIRKLKKIMQKNEELLSLEPLTKLLNRSALLRVSSEFIDHAAKKKQKVGAIFIDIDYFKEYNDEYGHAAGDEIIREIARACKKQETENIRFARYGGDEFFGITLGLTDEELRGVARRIAGSIRCADIPHVKNPNGGRITLSAGVVNVAITESTDTILEIVNYADKAVYYAKNSGRNAVYALIRDNAASGSGASYVRIDF